METRFNEVPRDRGNFFVISRGRYIEHLHDLTNFRENYQNDRYIEVKLIINFSKSSISGSEKLLL